MGKLDINKIKSKLDDMEKESVDYEYMKLSKGENEIRLLPPLDEDAPFYVETGYHYDIGPSQTTVQCPRLTEAELGGGGECPICNLVKRLRKSDKKSDKKLVDDLKATKRIFFNAVDVANPEKGAQILPMGVTIFKDILSTISHKDYGDISDRETGTNLTIKKKGEGRDTEYTTTPRKNSTKLDDIEDIGDVDELLKNAPDLKALIRLPSPAEIQAILDGEDTDEDDEDEDDEDDKPAKKGKSKPSKPAKKGKSKDEEEEDEEDDKPACFGEEFEEDDDTCDSCPVRKDCKKLVRGKAEDDKPAKKGKSKDEEEEDEEEDDKPAKKGKSKDEAPAKDVKDTSSKVKDVLNKMKKGK